MTLGARGSQCEWVRVVKPVREEFERSLPLAPVPMQAVYVHDKGGATLDAHVSDVCVSLQAVGGVRSRRRVEA